MERMTRRNRERLLEILKRNVPFRVNRGRVYDLCFAGYTTSEEAFRAALDLDPSEDGDYSDED